MAKDILSILIKAFEATINSGFISAPGNLLHPLFVVKWLNHY